MKVKYITPFVAFGLVTASPQLPSIKDKVYELLSGKRQGIERPIQQASGSGLERVLEGVAYAQSVEGISVVDYYKIAQPADDIVPGMRIGPYKSKPPVRAVGFGFIEDLWLRFYNDNKQNGNNEFYKYLSELNGKIINVDGISFIFDSKKLINFIDREHDKFRAVGFYGQFMVIDYADRSKRVVIPLTSETVKKIKKLDKY